jgi:hypothetical protein
MKKILSSIGNKEIVKSVLMALVLTLLLLACKHLSGVTETLSQKKEAVATASGPGYVMLDETTFLRSSVRKDVSVTQTFAEVSIWMLGAIMLAFIFMPALYSYIHSVNILQAETAMAHVNARRQCTEQLVISTTRLISALVFAGIFLR